MDDKTIPEGEAPQSVSNGQKRHQYIISIFRDKISFKYTFTALKYRNYRLWFWGQMISLFGTWMQNTAQGYLIFELTQSPVYLGYVGFAMGIPAWLFMLYGGVIADRFPKRSVLVLTQITMMILAFILAVLSFAGIVAAWHIILLAFGLGIANAFDAPARQAFVLELVERDDLTNAIALNSTMFNAATAIGPAVAGIVYAVFGPAVCFTVNGISFIGVISALLLMKMQPRQKYSSQKSTFSDLMEGIHYVRTNKIVRTIVILIAIITLFGVSFLTLIPAWAVTVLHGDATTNGLLQSARGVGALLSALAIASLGRFKFKGKLLSTGILILPFLLIIFSFFHWLSISLLLLVGVGAAIILVFNIANALIQTLVPDLLRGRVLGVYSMAFFGLAPIGSLIIGIGAEQINEPVAIMISAIITFIFAGFAWIKVPELRVLE